VGTPEILHGGALSTRRAVRLVATEYGRSVPPRPSDEPTWNPRSVDAGARRNHLRLHVTHELLEILIEHPGEPVRLPIVSLGVAP